MTDAPKKGRTAVATGPTGRTVGENILRLRQRHLMTTRILSDNLARVGRPVSQSSITRMERGEKVVTVDDLAALAVVFRVSPAALLLPLDDDPDTAVVVTGAGEVAADAAWAWASSERPLVPVDHQDGPLEYALLSLPPRRRAKAVRRAEVDA